MSTWEERMSQRSAERLTGAAERQAARRRVRLAEGRCQADGCDRALSKADLATRDVATGLVLCWFCRAPQWKIRAYNLRNKRRDSE